MTALRGAVARRGCMGEPVPPVLFVVADRRPRVDDRSRIGQRDHCVLMAGGVGLGAVRDEDARQRLIRKPSVIGEVLRGQAKRLRLYGRVARIPDGELDQLIVRIGY